MKYKSIGIIGGVGPLAAAAFEMQILKLVNASTDQEYPVIFHYNNSQIPDRTKHIVSSGADPVPSIQKTIDVLVAAGAEVLAMPCNTGHAFVDKLNVPSGAYYVRLDYAVRDYILKEFDQARIGILCTDGTRASKVYDKVFFDTNCSLMYPNQRDQARIMDAIYGNQGIKSGDTEHPKEELLQVTQSLIENGANVIIAGCTEIPLVLKECSVPIIDTIDVLARAVLDASAL